MLIKLRLYFQMWEIYFLAKDSWRSIQWQIVLLSMSSMFLAQYFAFLIIVYSIYRALIPNAPKSALHNKNNKILNLQNYIVIL